jgi:hypothetical protein
MNQARLYDMISMENSTLNLAKVMTQSERKIRPGIRLITYQ